MRAVRTGCGAPPFRGARIIWTGVKEPALGSWAAAVYSRKEPSGLTVGSPDAGDSSDTGCAIALEMGWRKICTRPLRLDSKKRVWLSCDHAGAWLIPSVGVNSRGAEM